MSPQKQPRPAHPKRVLVGDVRARVTVQMWPQMELFLKKLREEFEARPRRFQNLPKKRAL